MSDPNSIPIPELTSRDQDDPLSPDAIRNVHLSAAKALQEYQVLARLDRNITSEPDWRQLKNSLVECLRSTDDAIRLLEGSLADRREITRLLRAIREPSGEDIDRLGAALAEAREVEAALVAARETRRELRGALGLK